MIRRRFGRLSTLERSLDETTFVTTIEPVCRIVMDPRALSELGEVPVFHRRRVLDMIEQVLSQSPTVETRSRVKRMQDGFHPPYRLRVGDYRVYYDVDETQKTVHVLHVWKKEASETRKAPFLAGDEEKP
ncbi:MAG: type II toxin-antitoxin system RelE/ParE family toxin [Planctomycetes bacterium]|nr:type II toxin-antitoxin system RelE/ParE family toxin [Planctomycetota bacterium]